MNRTVIIGAIVVLLAAGGYYLYGRSAPEVMQDATKAATDGAAAVTEGAEAATGAATEAVTEGAEAVAEGAEAATGAATEAVTEGAEAATGAVADAAAALDPANFNADSVAALIDGSTLDDATKTTLKTAVEAAKANPALVADTIAQVKTALGM